jgi:DNA-binding HxlR family transcriptional regulator
MALRQCGVEGVREALRAIGGKWKCELLWHLREGPKRYAEMRRAVGRVTDRVLSRQLRELVDEGLVHRKDFGEVPPRVAYSLTRYGRSFDGLLVQLSGWGERHRTRKS